MEQYMRENAARDLHERRETIVLWHGRRVETIVLWHGQYSNDGAERLPGLEQLGPMLHLTEVRMEGRGGDWRIVADAYVATPAREGFTTTWSL